MEAIQVSINRWMDKEGVKDICSGILLCHKIIKFCPCNDMDGPREYYASEISEKKTNTVCHHLYVKYKKWIKYV